ncbi:hypothetical protein BGZ94_006549, partial [Podila epigama]
PATPPRRRRSAPAASALPVVVMIHAPNLRTSARAQMMLLTLSVVLSCWRSARVSRRLIPELFTTAPTVKELSLRSRRSVRRVPAVRRSLLQLAPSAVEQHAAARVLPRCVPVPSLTIAVLFPTVSTSALRMASLCWWRPVHLARSVLLWQMVPFALARTASARLTVLFVVHLSHSAATSRPRRCTSASRDKIPSSNPTATPTV